MDSSTLSSEFVIKLSPVPLNSPMSKLFFWAIIALSAVNAIVSLTIGHLSNYFNPQITASLRGFISSLIAVTLAVLVSINGTKEYLVKTKIPILIVIGLIGVLSLSFQFALGFYFGGWGCALWLIAALYGAYLSRTQDNQHLPVHSSIDQHILESNPKINAPSITETLIQKPTCCSKCCDCCYVACLVVTLVLMAVIAAISIVYFANWQQYGVYGQLIEVKIPQKDWTVKIQAYCVGQPQPARPTIVLEHGGGSNSIAFLQLGNIISQSNWHLCAYDRLGYGRSSILPRYLTVEQRAFITNSVINQLLRGQPNQNIIIGGWSAGVEISQIYAKIYAQNVKGVIFMDGYPDYLILDAICNNKSEAYQSPALASSQILRFLEPIGADLAVGSNPIPNNTVSSFYRAYYQTGYFWESQYLDLANPSTSATQWLTQNAGNSAIPYPASSIPLNWPQIAVPLLVMPANGTVYGGEQCGTMYLTQSQKFIQKCNSTKLLQVMPGKHDFVLQSAQLVADQINTFFAPLF